MLLQWIIAHFGGTFVPAYQNSNLLVLNPSNSATFDKYVTNLKTPKRQIWKHLKFLVELYWLYSCCQIFKYSNTFVYKVPNYNIIGSSQIE